MQLELQPILVATSCDSEAVGDRIARGVLEEKLAACVQISGTVRSSYWWQGEIATDTEYLVTMKTDRQLFNKICEVIRRVHPYEVPEIIATEIVAVDEPYARWLRASLQQ
ncbi:MAG: divalent-cation tolerance protein CutA [Desulfofustis sp.]|jgi:periplasmic divalent cation tolerance protein|nr:divalent-cation tolerance protein CutA [Desulfofustis sp.]